MTPQPQTQALSQESEIAQLRAENDALKARILETEFLDREHEQKRRKLFEWASIEEGEKLKAENDRLTRELESARADFKAEAAIVTRIWKQLGNPTYEELKGRSIYDLIDDLRAKLATAERERDEAKAVEGKLDLGRLIKSLPEDVNAKVSLHDLKRLTDNYNTIPCPNCYGGHQRPCQWCGDSGRVVFAPNIFAERDRLRAVLEAIIPKIQQLTRQGEDYIWRPVTAAIAIAENALDATKGAE